MKKRMNDLKILLGRRIRSLRRKKNWTQEELGERAKINYKYVGRVECGRQNVSVEILIKIANALKVEMSELFQFDHEYPDRRELESEVFKKVKKLTEEDLKKLYVALKLFCP